MYLLFKKYASIFTRRMSGYHQKISMIEEAVCADDNSHTDSTFHLYDYYFDSYITRSKVGWSKKQNQANLTVAIRDAEQET